MSSPAEIKPSLTVQEIDNQFVVAFNDPLVTEENKSGIRHELLELLSQVKTHDLDRLIISLKNVEPSAALFWVLETIERLYKLDLARLQHLNQKMGEVVIVDTSPELFEVMVNEQVAIALLGLTPPDIAIVQKDGVRLKLNLPQLANQN